MDIPGYDFLVSCLIPGADMNYVIAVAAPVGGGKTSYVREIARILEDASIVYYDHYENLTEKPVEQSAVLQYRC